MLCGRALIELLCSLSSQNSFFANSTLSIIFFPPVHLGISKIRGPAFPGRHLSMFIKFLVYFLKATNRLVRSFPYCTLSKGKLLRQDLSGM